VSINNVKSSVQKAVRSKLVEQFPFIEDYLEQIIPKKDPLRTAKWWDVQWHNDRVAAASRNAGPHW